MQELASTLIAWMKANESLAGWAQFAGATVALVVAIWVPWYQSRLADRALALARIERELASVQGVFFLLTDIQIWLKSAAGRGNIPRKEFNDGFEANDLLERIRLWESREERDVRVNAMFLARGALTRAQRALALPFLADRPVTDDERIQIQKDVNAIDVNIHALQRQRHDAHRTQSICKTMWLMKPVAILVWKLRPYEDHRSPAQVVGNSP